MSTTDTIPRKALKAALKPVLPKEWRIIPYETNPDVQATTVVMLKQESIERNPAAPLGAHDIGFTVTIESPLDGLEKAEDELDDGVVLLLHKLDELHIAWKTAKKVLATSGRLAYDITLTITSYKE